MYSWQIRMSKEKSVIAMRVSVWVSLIIKRNDVDDS